MCGLAAAATPSCDDGGPTQPPMVAVVAVTAISDTLFSAGATTRLSAEARAGNGSVIPNTTFTWTTSDSTVVTVDSAGLATAAGPNGAATITASAGGIAGTVVINVVTGAIGGTVIAAGGKVRLEIPAGAVPQPVAVTVHAVHVYPDPGPIVAGTVYDLGPDGTQFAEPIQLSIGYETAGIPAGVAEEELRVYQLVEDVWIELQGSTVNTADRTVIANIEHFSVFAVSGAQPLAEEIDPQSGQIRPGGARVVDGRLAGTFFSPFPVRNLHIYLGRYEQQNIGNRVGVTLVCKWLLNPGGARCTGLNLATLLATDVAFIGIRAGRNPWDREKLDPALVPVGARCNGRFVADLDPAILHHELAHVFIQLFAGLPNSELAAHCFGYELTNHFGPNETDLGRMLQWLLDNLSRFDPTFVQMATRPAADSPSPAASGPSRLSARIVFPPPAALVRAEVPIYGIAAGSAFASYTVEYGEGVAPEVWIPVTRGNRPQETVDGLLEAYSPSDLPLRGNLATWDTGLKHYVYLPTHPADHPIDLKGTYTVRLVVEGIDGSTIEDRVTVFVANLLSNAWGGVAVSPDGRVRLEVPEHALARPFRLIGFEPVNDAPPLPDGHRVHGAVHAVREAGERFAADARLTFRISRTIEHEGPGPALYGHDDRSGEWQQLRTVRRSGADGEDELEAAVRRLHTYYAVLTNASATARATAEQPAAAASPADIGVTSDALIGHDETYLIRQTFETDGTEWRSRGEDGAVVTRVPVEPAGHALKITNARGGGSSGVRVLDTPFDAGTYPMVEFDYRIDAGVRTDFYVKVKGRWYNIGFTDDTNQFAYRRVNIAATGRIAGVVADGEWRRARFDLAHMLQLATGERRVEQIVMADWNVTGTMRLDAGANQAGATYWIDNFAIRRADQAGPVPDVIIIDDFSGSVDRNLLDQPTSRFTDGGAGWIRSELVDDSVLGASLRLQYDVDGTGRWSGYATGLPVLDVRAQRQLRFEARGATGLDEVLIGVRDAAGNESKVRLGDFVTRTWNTSGSNADVRSIAVPLVAFGPIIDLSGLVHISLSVAAPAASRGEFIVDDLRFERKLEAVVVDHFDRRDSTNVLGGGQHPTMSDEAVARTDFVYDGANRNLRIVYGGAIPWGWAGWRSQLRGLDCSRCTNIRLRIRGAHGGERPNLYLDDGTHRWPVDLERYGEITTEWRDLTIPLADFAREGIDLTHLVALELVFEWEPMSGAIYVDDIRFGPPHPP